MNTVEEITNEAKLRGKIIDTPVKTYEIEDEEFYEMKVSVERLSGTNDIIPVTISKKLVDAGIVEIGEGKEIAVKGEFRSYNKDVNGKSKLMLHFFVQDKANEEDDPENNSNFVKLSGFICKPPVYRVTPFNREICDILVAVNRPARGGRVCKSDYIPCIVWGRNARALQNEPVGTKVMLTGRIQSRQYNKAVSEGVVEQRTAYELSCQSMLVERANAQAGEIV